MFQSLLRYTDTILCLRWKLATILFLIGLCMRLPVFGGAHEEGDELIYMNLVLQLDAGHGYTLHGSPLLEQGETDKDEYDRPLFFHPPGGTALNWVFFKMFGGWGFPIVQLFSYVLFFWSMMLLAYSLQLTASNLALATTAVLSAFNPIMAHVTTRFWLDGPLLAFTTLAVALFLWAASNNRRGWALTSGLILGFASLIKVIAFLVVPGALLLIWFLLSTIQKTSKKPQKHVVSKLRQLRKFVRYSLMFLVPALIVQFPWEVWQWMALGSPFPGLAGKPSFNLIEHNSYVRYLTLGRPAWIYLTLTPRIVWTLIPSFLLFALLWKRKTAWRRGMSLIIWILIVLLFQVMLGYLGYSKVLRYIILITPATVILFSSLLDETIRGLRGHGMAPAFKRAAVIAVIISVAAMFMEIAAGTHAALISHKDLLVPLLGRFY